MSDELYKKYRPTKFSEVVGQKEAVAQLVDMGKRNAVPHAILFTGPSGVGKTTLARILRRKIKCSDMDFYEINSADCRGIDDIRDIRSRMSSSPIGGGTCRVWLIDEVHQLTSDAQNAFLKMLEDTPSHVFFFLATTDPGKLKKTIITRSTEVRCKPISEEDLKNLVIDISPKEGSPLSEKVAKKIASVSEGSARKALVILHAIIGFESELEQLAAIESSDVKGQAIEIARALMKKETTWKQMAEILDRVDDDPESLRRMILAYSTSVLLKSGNGRAVMIIEEFREPLYNVLKPGLVASCFAIVSGG